MEEFHPCRAVVWCNVQDLEAALPDLSLPEQARLQSLSNVVLQESSNLGLVDGTG